MLYALDFECAGLSERHTPGTVHCFSLASRDSHTQELTSVSYRWTPENIMLLKHLVECGTEWVFHNAAYDVGVARTHGVDIKEGSYDDTMCMFYSMYPGQPAGLDDVCQQFLGRGKGAKVDFSTWSVDMEVYNALDAELTLDLFYTLCHELDCWPDAKDSYLHVDLPYVERIIEMTKHGVSINRAACAEEIVIQKEVVKEAYAELMTFAPRGVKPSASSVLHKKYGANLLGMQVTTQFNPGSNPHVIQMFSKLGIDIPGLTKSGQPQVNNIFLESVDHDFARQLLRYRKASKFLSAFLEAIYSRVSDDSPRLRGSFRQFHVKTGRLSCADPNLQNVPSRDERGAKIRRMFVPADGCFFLVGDLDRIELVVLGFELERYGISSVLSDRIKSGEDVHQSNTDDWSTICNKVLERKRCKNGIFAIIYGCGVKKFADTVGCTVADAKRVFAESPLIAAVLQLKTLTVNEAIAGKGFFTNCLGRQLYVPDIMMSGKTRAGGERKVFNYRIQSAAGDAFKILQNDASSSPALTEMKLLLVVHDEAVYETPDLSSYTTYERMAYLAEYCQILSGQFSTDQLLRTDNGIWASIRCEFHHGLNWYDAK